MEILSHIIEQISSVKLLVAEYNGNKFILLLLVFMLSYVKEMMNWCCFAASDWTMYPFSTQNLQDYQNLMSVYLDAVFFPLLRPLDFR